MPMKFHTRRSVCAYCVPLLHDEMSVCSGDQRTASCIHEHSNHNISIRIFADKAVTQNTTTDEIGSISGCEWSNVCCILYTIYIYIFIYNMLLNFQEKICKRRMEKIANGGKNTYTHTQISSRRQNSRVHNTRYNIHGGWCQQPLALWFIHHSVIFFLPSFPLFPVYASACLFITWKKESLI